MRILRGQEIQFDEVNLLNVCQHKMKLCRMYAYLMSRLREEKDGIKDMGKLG